MFEFFKFGFFPGLFHLLFMSTLPLAIFLWIGEARTFAVIIFLLGAPFFRALRNRSLGF